jgi:hypothetical protein
MTYSEAIDKVVEAATSEGNKILEISTGWSKVREVVHMKFPLSDTIRKSLHNNNRLRAWTTNATPHNKAEEGYTDDLEKVSIAFPLD